MNPRERASARAAKLFASTRGTSAIWDALVDAYEEIEKMKDNDTDREHTNVVHVCSSKAGLLRCERTHPHFGEHRARTGEKWDNHEEPFDRLYKGA